MPSKPRFPKFPHLCSCAWFKNQKVYIFGMALSCLQVFLEASMAAPNSLTVCVGEEGENGWLQLHSLVSCQRSFMSHQ